MDSRFLESGTTNYSSPIAGEQEKLLKGAPGKLFYLRVVNTTGAKIFVFVFNGLTNAGPPLVPPIPVNANDQFEMRLPGPLGFSTGLVIGASTGALAYVAAGANSLQISAITK